MKSVDKDTLRKWIQDNPNGYLEKSYKEISKETGVSEAYVSIIIPEVIADRDGCLPSEVMQKRYDIGHPRRMSIPDNTRKRIVELSKTHNTRDVAYLTQVSRESVYRILKENQNDI